MNNNKQLDEISVLYDVLHCLKIEDITLSYNKNNKLIVKDSMNNKWKGYEFYLFLINEAFVYTKDGVLGIDNDLLQDFYVCANECKNPLDEKSYYKNINLEQYDFIRQMLVKYDDNKLKWSLVNTNKDINMWNFKCLYNNGIDLKTAVHKLFNGKFMTACKSSELDILKNILTNQLGWNYDKYNELEKILNSTTSYYKVDYYYYDISFLSFHPDITEFVWIPRETGTCLIPINKLIDIDNIGTIHINDEFNHYMNNTTAKYYYVCENNNTINVSQIRNFDKFLDKYIVSAKKDYELSDKDDISESLDI